MGTNPVAAPATNQITPSGGQPGASPDPRADNNPLSVKQTGTAILDDFANPTLAQSWVVGLSTAGTASTVIDRVRLACTSPATFAKIGSDATRPERIEAAVRWAGSAALIGSTNDVVPHDNSMRGPLRIGGARIGKWQVPEHTFASGWQRLYQFENASVAAYGIGQLAVGGYSLYAGMHEGDGAKGAFETRDGRSGLAQLAGGTIVAYVGARTIAKAGGLRALTTRAGIGRILSDEHWGRTSVALAEVLPVVGSMLNAAGAFDFLDARKDDHRSAGTKANDAIKALPHELIQYFL